MDLPYPQRPLAATIFGPCCPQTGSTPGGFQDEQCLYLNIFSPLNATRNDRLPVLFWIHGGGGVAGCSSQSTPKLYNGTNMIAQGQQVIVVTINYRLGMLSSLFLEELARENAQKWPTSGNYYLLDVQSALRWVQLNIKKFGGDPSRVLMFGESAGGNLAVDLGAARGSAGLYHHVISQSGVAMSWNAYTTRTVANANGQRLSQRAGCRTVDCLRKSNVSKLLEAYSDAGSDAIYTVIDGYFIPYYPSVAIVKGTYLNNVGVTIGHNLPDLYLACTTDPKMDSRAAVNYVKENYLEVGIPAARLDDVLNNYRVQSCSPNGQCCQLVTDLLNDFTMLCNARRLLNGLSAKNNRNLYWYRFDCAPTCPTERFPGVCRHTSEIAYVFGTVSNYGSRAEPNCTWSKESRTFSTTVIEHWAKMAATGRPLPSWKSYSKEKPNYYHITPYESFATRAWNGDCKIADEIEQKQVDLLFRSVL